MRKGWACRKNKTTFCKTAIWSSSLCQKNFCIISKLLAEKQLASKHLHKSWHKGRKRRIPVLLSNPWCLTHPGLEDSISFPSSASGHIQAALLYAWQASHTQIWMAWEPLNFHLSAAHSTDGWSINKWQLKLTILQRQVPCPTHLHPPHSIPGLGTRTQQALLPSEVNERAESVPFSRHVVSSWKHEAPLKCSTVPTLGEKKRHRTNRIGRFCERKTPLFPWAFK